MATVMDKLGGADRGGDGNIGGGGNEKKVTTENAYFNDLKARLAQKGIDPKADRAARRAGGGSQEVAPAGGVAPVIPRAPMPAPVAGDGVITAPVDSADRVVLYDDNGHPIK